jgi:2-polyprenyl-3-methyl-5-hydroxy-6-metoxy-1,4-benzoquinol methylase
MVDSSELKKFTEANRKAWNEVMPRHQKAAKEKWDHAFMQSGYVCLDEVEIKLLKEMGIKGKDVTHLCCNNGVELLSLKNMGANNCVGFDISDEAIREAAARAELSNIDCQFIRSDVYDIEDEYKNLFDVIYFSAGGLGWLPDLRFIFAKASELLRSTGWVFIHEIHPFSEMLPFDDDEGENHLRIIEPYFKEEPYVDYGNLDYVGQTTYTSKIPQYWFVHTLSDIMMSLIDNQILIYHFTEYGKDISAGHQRIEQSNAGIPLSYILIGRK